MSMVISRPVLTFFANISPENRYVVLIYFVTLHSIRFDKRGNFLRIGNHKVVQNGKLLKNREPSSLLVWPNEEKQTNGQL